jgi:triosephosphate isomerase
MTLWIGTSWKMNKGLQEALSFADALHHAAAVSDPRVQPFVMPAFTTLRDVSIALRGTRVLVGAQNMHWADDGAWTGEISAPMLEDCGAALVEVGHAERRAHFNETDDTVGLKVEAAVRNGLVPLICIGETRSERDAGRTDAILETQVTAALGKLTGRQTEASILLVYEPVWAIGAAGVPATAEYADHKHARILDVAGSVLGRRVPCLYGGSVTVDNCAELVSQPNIDGLFIGRSAWQVETFIEILAKCAMV